MSATGSIQIVRGACGHDCPDTCSWIVEVHNGTAGKLYGDPAHPFTRGTLCAKVNHYLERVYHPDRVLHPLKRVGPKGEGRFVRVSWDEALTDIASRWQAIVEESGAEAILPYSSAGVQGLIQQASLDMRLFGSMGCSGLDRNICGAVASAGLTSTIGTGTGIDPEEVVHSRYVVLWGTNTIVTNLHFWPLVREAQRRGAKIVVVDPVRTRTAEAADWHLPIKPASDAALALAMMHVIVRDGLVDHEYVSQYAVGYEALVEHVRQYAPESVAATVGLPANDIERFAREYATTQPSLLRPLIGPEHHRNGAMQFRTMACLPVLTGAWRHRGGGLARSTHKLHFAVLDMDSVTRPEVHQPGVRVLNMRDLGKDLCGLQPPIRSLIVYGANPMVSMPNQSRIREGLLRDDLFTVVHELFVTDTALYADYVLPGHEPDRASGSVTRLGPPVSGAESARHRAARRIGVEHRALPTAGTGARPHGGVPVRERRVHAACGSGERASVARRDHVRTVVGAGIRALEPSGGLAPVCKRRLPNPKRKGGAVLRAAARGRARPAAIARRDSIERRSAIDHGEAAALPEFGIQQSGPASPPRGRVVHRDPRGRRADARRRQRGVRVRAKRER